MGMVCAPSYTNIFMDHYVYSFLQAHNSIKFEYEISQTNTHFLIQKSLFKITNLLQKSIRKALTTRTFFIQIQVILIRQKTVFHIVMRLESTGSSLHQMRRCEELKERCVSQCQQPQLINKHKSNGGERTLNNTTSKETKILLLLIYSSSLLDISKVVCKCWNILYINKAFKEIFQNEPVTAFRRNKNLKELIGSNKIEHNKVKKHNNLMKKLKCFHCSANNRTFCCRQVISSSIFKSQQTNKSYTIFRKVNSSRAYVIYLKESTLCNQQYVGNLETSFNIRQSNHCKHFKNLMPYQHGCTSKKKTSFQQTRKFHHYGLTYKYHQIKSHFKLNID